MHLQKIGKESQFWSVVQRIPKLPPSSMQLPWHANTSPIPPRHHHSPCDPSWPCTLLAVDPGCVFIDDIGALLFERTKNSGNHHVPDVEDSDNDAHWFMTAMIDKALTKVFMVIPRQDWLSRHCQMDKLARWKLHISAKIASRNCLSTGLSRLTALSGFGRYIYPHHSEFTIIHLTVNNCI